MTANLATLSILDSDFHENCAQLIVVSCKTNLIGNVAKHLEGGAASKQPVRVSLAARGKCVAN
jgi:hypothetical protein